LIAGQAAGDREALLGAKRSLVSVDLGGNPTDGVNAIADLEAGSA
jgi:hypothetical protein